MLKCFSLFNASLEILAFFIYYNIITSKTFLDILYNIHLVRPKKCMAGDEIIPFYFNSCIYSLQFFNQKVEKRVILQLLLTRLHLPNSYLKVSFIIKLKIINVRDFYDGLTEVFVKSLSRLKRAWKKNKVKLFVLSHLATILRRITIFHDADVYSQYP